MAKKRQTDHGTGIPPHEMESLARVLLSEIQKLFKSKAGQKEFKGWKEQ